MSTLRNSVQLIGHLGADPEIKTLESGLQIAKMRLATSDSKKNANGEWQEETQWHNVIAWEAVAERAEKYLHKGSFVLVQGKLTNRNYTDAQGAKKYFTEVRATTFMLLDKNKNTTEEAIPSSEGMAEEDGGLPF